MPDPFNRTKMSGDTHPPEIEPELPFGDDAMAGGSGSATDRATATERSEVARPGGGDAKRGEQPDREPAPHSERSSQR